MGRAKTSYGFDREEEKVAAVPPKLVGLEEDGWFGEGGRCLCEEGRMRGGFYSQRGW